MALYESVSQPIRIYPQDCPAAGLLNPQQTLFKGFIDSLKLTKLAYMLLIFKQY